MNNYQITLTGLDNKVKIFVQHL